MDSMIISLFDEAVTIQELTIINGDGIARMPASSLDMKLLGSVFLPPYMAIRNIPTIIHEETPI